MKTEEFEVNAPVRRFVRSDDGRVVAKPAPPIEREAFGSIGQTGDWDAAPPYPQPIEEPEQPFYEVYWREVITVILGVLIILSLALAFLTRNRPDAAPTDGDSERIESIGELPSDVLPRTQGVFGEPELEGGSSSNDTSNSSATSSPLTSESSDDEDTASEGSESNTSLPGTSVVTTPTPVAPSTSVPATTITTQLTTTTTAPTTITTAPTTTPPPIEASVVNGGFDAASVESGGYAIVGSVSGWVSQAGEFEIWHGDKDGVGAVDGDYLLELNANGQGLIYQDFATTPGTAIRWEFSHRGRSGKESVEFLLGTTGGQVETIKVVTSGKKWNRYSGRYVVPEGQTTTRMIFRSLEPGSSGNLLDAVTVELAKRQ